MEIFEALRLEIARLCGGIEIEHGGARHVALFEANALAVLEIDGGEKDHDRAIRKRGTLSLPRPLRGRAGKGGRRRDGGCDVPAARRFARTAPATREAADAQVCDEAITASTSGNSRSAPARSAGSFPDETACRSWCRGRRWPSRGRRNWRAPARRGRWRR